MNKNEKLNIVFDFIADYLSEEVTKIVPEDIEETTETTETNTSETDNSVVTEEENDDSLKRAYKIIMKLEERDKKKVEVKAEEEREKIAIKVAQINQKYEREECFIRTQKSIGAKLIAYNPKNFMPVFLSEDGTYGVTLDVKGYEIGISLDEVREKYAKIPKMVNDEIEKDERTGVTLDTKGNIIKVSAPTLTPDTSELIKAIEKSKDNPMTNEEWEDIKKKEKQSPNNID